MPSEDAHAAGGWRRSWAPHVLVFCTSAAVLVIEILAGRLVAPYVGVSLETYTGIIGTVLAGIALGSWWGGQVADRTDARRVLGPLLIASGIATLLALPIISGLGPGVANQGGGPGGIVLLAVAAFVLPTALLSAVSPMSAKLRLASTEETGTVVGGLSASATAGALVGTFLTGFVFVAALPTRPVLIGIGIALALAGAVISVRLGRRPPAVAALALLLAAGLTQVIPSPCQRDTVYYCASVVHDTARPDGRVLMLDNLRHSYVALDDPTHLQFRYTDLFAAVVDGTLGPQPVNALHIGGGGFTFPRWLMATRPGTTNRVLELDQEVVRLAQDELGLRLDPEQLSVRTGDARMNLLDEPDAAYDLVVGDAFGGLSVPWHLTTTEFVDDIARTMKPTGLYILNVIDRGPQRLAKAVAKTLTETFDNVVVIAPPGGTNGNHVLAASDARINTDEVSSADGDVVDLAAFIRDSPVLRDDYAPVDQLITRR